MDSISLNIFSVKSLPRNEMGFYQPKKNKNVGKVKKEGHPRLKMDRNIEGYVQEDNPLYDDWLHI